MSAKTFVPALGAAAGRHRAARRFCESTSGAAR
jgi:hypothetical protein